MYDLQSDTVISNALANAANRGDDNPLFTGEVGRFAGFVFVMSTNAQFYSGVGFSTSTGISDVYASLAVGRNAYAITELDNDTVETIYHPPGSGGSTGDQLNMVASLGWKINFAPAVLNQSWLRRIEHTVSA